MTPETLLSELEAGGFRGSMVPVKRLQDLQNEIETRRRESGFDQGLERDYLSAFRFLPPVEPAGAKSIIMVAAPVPQVEIAFHRRGKPVWLRIPPTYFHDSDASVLADLSKILNPAGYRLARASLPEKLLAVRSGLARYGRNNVAYVRGLGSFHRPIAFFSDMPCEIDSWHEETLLDRCLKCTVCMRACPTGAIAEGRFLIHAEKCLTFMNERPGEFPAWLKTGAHHCLVGCMQCQETCPENRGVKDWIERKGSFTEEETELLLAGGRPSAETRKKLADLYLLEYLCLMPRNLGVLMDGP